MDRLVERWEKPLFGFAWRSVRNAADARDLAAETLVRLHQHRMRLAPDSKVSAWLFTTLLNLCRNHHRWRGRHPFVSVDDAAAQEQVTAEPNPDTGLEQRETLDALAAAIDRLPVELKETLLLHHYEQLSYREIAAIARCSERGIETRLRRAKLRLREELTGLRADAG